MTTHNIAFLGLGAMGTRMARRLIAGGHSVTVWNRTPGREAPLLEAGGRAAATPAEAADGAEFVISMVRDDDAARTVWLDTTDGALATARDGAIAIECSTTSPGWARELHQACEGAGIMSLDAPVVGSRPQAEAGKLIFLVGGEERALLQAHSLLLAMGAAVHHAGSPGAGAVVKLMVNTLFGVQVATLAELLALARSGGINPARAIEIVAATPTASPAAMGAAAGMLAEQFAPMFPVELVAKDFALANGLFSGPLIERALAVFRRAEREGLADQNLAAVAKLY